MRNLRIALLALATLYVAPSSKAGPGGCTNSPFLTPFAFEQITVSSTALGFTAATAFPDGLPGAAMAVVSVESNAVRYRADGIVPTAAVGMPIAVDGVVTVCGALSIKRIKFIRVSSDATISVHYYREGDQ